MTNQPDLTYIKGSIFTSFCPETAEGRKAYDEMCDALGGVASVLNTHLKPTLRQLRKAGYTVSASKPVTVSDDELLSQLGIA